MANEKKAKGENILYNLGFNIIIPVLILTKYSDVNHLGALNGLIIALAFPLFYGLYDLIIRKKKNFISILGFISVLITGIIGIFEFPQEYIAYKELLIPSLIGTAVIASIWTPFPLVKKLFYNEEILNIARIEETLTASNSMPKLDSIMKTYSILLGLSLIHI